MNHFYLVSNQSIPLPGHSDITLYNISQSAYSRRLSEKCSHFDCFMHEPSRASSFYYFCIISMVWVFSTGFLGKIPVNILKTAKKGALKLCAAFGGLEWGVKPLGQRDNTLNPFWRHIGGAGLQRCQPSQSYTDCNEAYMCCGLGVKGGGEMAMNLQLIAQILPCATKP